MLPVRKYSEWRDTADVIHMLMQMMGKVKLGRMPPQPEWGQALLQPTPTGYTTGLIPGELESFDILLDLAASRVVARCTSGLTAGFPLHGERSIRDYYEAFGQMLAYIGHPTAINPQPQEMAITTPFDQQTAPLAYDARAARDYFDVSVFAHNALLVFASPYRGKKILPSLFWGTFDMTTVLFAGIEKPFDGGGRIEKVAFDEQFVEFGFWPGDGQVDDPSFFALPYPFLQGDGRAVAGMPPEAFYSEAKKEFMLPLKAIAGQTDPTDQVVRFCHGVFDAVASREGWQHVAWLTKPLEH